VPSLRATAPRTPSTFRPTRYAIPISTAQANQRAITHAKPLITAGSYFRAGQFESCGLRVLKSPPQAPRANAICERLIGTLRREVLDHLLILNKRHLRTVLAQFAVHYNAARPHQGIARRVPDDDPENPTARVIDLDTARIRRKPVLGGLTSEYQLAE
jgi:transposase InsO family protein